MYVVYYIKYVFIDEDVSQIFNNFLNIYLRIYNASFPVIKRTKFIKPSPWITSGIKISCITKRNLYVKYRDCKDQSHKDNYKKYCKILSSVIRDAKNVL